MGGILFKDCRTRLWVPAVIRFTANQYILNLCIEMAIQTTRVVFQPPYVLLFTFLVLTVCLSFPRESESDRSVTEAGREVLCSPLENGPVQRHVHEDCRLLQMMQNLLDLVWAEGLRGVRLGHGL